MSVGVMKHEKVNLVIYTPHMYKTVFLKYI